MSRRDERHHFWFEPVKSQCAFSISLLQGDLGAHWSRMVIHKLQCAYNHLGVLLNVAPAAGRGGEDLKFFISNKQLNGVAVSAHTFEEGRVV